MKLLDTSETIYSERIENIRFDGDFKKEFASSKTKISIMKKLDRIERKFGKSIFSMNTKELIKVLEGFGCGSLQSLQSIHSMITKYIEFVNEKTGTGYYAHMGISGDDLRVIVSKDDEGDKYLSKKEYENIIFNRSIQPQDRAILVLLWNGVVGQLFDDLVNFKEKDIEKLNITDREREVLILATNQSDYHKLSLEKNSIRSINPKNEYVIKSTESHKSNGLLPLKYQDISYRVKELSDILGRNFTAKTIIASSNLDKVLKHFDYQRTSHKEMRDYMDQAKIPMSRSKVTRLTDIILDKMKY